MAPAPALPSGPPRPVPPNPAANRKAPLAPSHTPTSGNPVLDDPKNKHLQKAKPPALDHRAGSQAPNLGDTDPSLRKYQDRRAGGGIALKITLVIFGIVIALFIAILFVKPVRDAVRPFFPNGIQKALLALDEQSPAPVSAPTPAPMPAPAPGAPTSAVNPAPVVAPAATANPTAGAAQAFPTTEPKAP